tara:strand:+ start:7914 stop:8090 length:177 start_codon:yes stop_codon:yes gene_type:complete
MSTPHKEDTLNGIYDDLPYTHPEEWAAIQKQWGEGASLGDCLDAYNALVNKIYEDQSL